MLVRVGIAFAVFVTSSMFLGCALPLSIEDDSLGVTGGLVPPPTTTQRANSRFEGQEPNPSEEAAAQPTPSPSSDNVDLAADSEIMPPKNFRPLIP